VLNIYLYLIIASGLHSTTYGWDETNCGDIGVPRPCSHGAITASGEVFDPETPTMAVFAPTKLRMGGRAKVVLVRLPGGSCKYVRVNDKGNPRYIGERGFDLTPAAITLLGEEPTKFWSGKVELCGVYLNQRSPWEIVQWNLQ